MMGGHRFAMPTRGGTVAIVIVRLLAIGVAVILATSAIQKSIDPRNTVTALEWAGLPGDFNVASEQATLSGQARLSLEMARCPHPGFSLART